MSYFNTVEKIFVISREQDKDRRSFVLEQLKNVGIGIPQIHWFNAVDGYKTDDEEFKKENINIGHKGSNGCALSHKNVWKYIVENKIKNAMVFEDDVIFHEYFPALYFQYYDKTPSNYGIIFMGYCSFDGEQNINAIYEYFPLCLHSYIIKYEMCEWLLTNFSNCDKNVDLYVKELYDTKLKRPLQDNLISYSWWNGALISPKQKVTELGVYFRGLVYQEHDFKKFKFNHSMFTSL